MNSALLKNKYATLFLLIYVAVTFLSPFFAYAEEDGEGSSRLQGGRGTIVEGLNERAQYNALEPFGGIGDPVPNAVIVTQTTDPVTGETITTEEAASAVGEGNQGTDQNPPANPITVRDGWAGTLYGVMITVGGGFTWIGGGVLDYAVKALVIQMGQLLNENIGVAVDSTWKIVRDMFNIVFIFVLVWIGLRTILDSDDSRVKKTLGGLIVAALLINFSLFITKTIVDFTNIAANEIYKGFSVPEGSDTLWSGIPTPAGQDTFIGGAANTDRSISVAFVHTMKLSSFAGQLQAEKGSWAIIFFGFLMMLVLMIAGFVFLAGGILLIYRFVALVIFMIFSPAMFLGFIYPSFKKYGDMWWSKFLANAFVAPAYLFMLYICLAVFQGLTPSGTFGNGFKAEAIKDGSFAVFLYFGVMVGFLIAATRVASLMGAAGASTVMKVGETGSNYIRGAATNLAMKPINWSRAVAANAGSDVHRNIPYVGGKSYEKSIKRLDKARSNIAQGKGTLGDRWTYEKAAFLGAGSVTDRRNTLEAGVAHKAFGGKSQKDIRGEEKAGKEQIAAFRKETEQNEYRDQLEEISKMDQSSYTDSVTKDNSKLITSLTESLDNLSKEEIGKLKVSVLSDEKVAIHLTEKHIDKLKDSGNFSDSEIKEIKDKRASAIEKVRKSDGSDMWGAIKNKKGQTYAAQILSRGKDDIKKLPDKIFAAKAFVEHINPTILKYKLEEGMGSEALTESRRAIQNEITRLDTLAKKSIAPIAGNASEDEKVAYNIAIAEQKEAVAKLNQWHNWSQKDNFGIRFGLDTSKYTKKQKSKNTDPASPTLAGFESEDAQNEYVDHQNPTSSNNQST